MAWTAPRTYVTGEVVTAAILNTDLRDNMLIVGARTLGYAQITADTATVTAETDVSGLAVTVSVGSSRRIQITAVGKMVRSVIDGTCRVYIKEGTTYHGHVNVQPVKANEGQGYCGAVSIVPASGSHTYKLSQERTTGTGNCLIEAATVSSKPQPAFILVEDIT